MIITKRHLSRRAVLKGIGVTAALPFLDAMAPAATALANTAAKGKIRFVAIEMVHGAAGSCTFGAQNNLWSPAATGRGFDLEPTSLAPLDPLREYLTIVSNTDVRMAEAFTTPEIGGDHFRASSVFLTQAHPKQTMGSDLWVGHVVRPDLRAAVRAGHGDSVDAALHRDRRSLGRLRVQLLVRLHRRDQLGGAERAAADAARPAGGVRYAVRRGATPEDRARRRREDQSVLDTIVAVDRPPQTAAWRRRPRAAHRYLDDVREIERRIQNIEAFNRSGETREMPNAPVGVPDSFDDHVKILFDLQAVALASDITRVFAFKLSRDVSGRVFPQTGVTTGFHNASHHNERPERILDFAKINRYHVSLVPYFLDRLKRTPDGDGTLLDNTLMIYGSPMGNPNVHNHKRCPLFLAGKAGGQLKGGLHIKAPDGTPMANVFLSMAHMLGMNDMASFGDSTGEFDLNKVG